MQRVFLATSKIAAENSQVKCTHIDSLGSPRVCIVPTLLVGVSGVVGLQLALTVWLGELR
jgi:hypothetical protein